MYVCIPNLNAVATPLGYETLYHILGIYKPYALPGVHLICFARRLIHYFVTLLLFVISKLSINLLVT